MKTDDATQKRFNKARKGVEARYKEIGQEADQRIKDLLEKTYKQFEKTYGANSRKT